MGIIKIENIRVFAHHGCLREETKIGSDYRVDLEIKANLIFYLNFSKELVDTKTRAEILKQNYYFN